MSRYNNPNAGNSNDNDYEDDTTLKLQKFAALRLSPNNLNSSTHDQYGTSFIVNYEDAAVIDGIVFQRDDKPDTWKIFSAGKFFHLNPEDGLVYENYDQDSAEYSGEMSAQDILDHPRVAGFSETFGGNDYFYTPVGVIIEEAGDIATNDDLEVETSDGPSIQIGDASMLLNNGTWVRTYAKKIAAAGDDIINDNGDEPTDRGEPETNPKYDSHEWLNEDNLELRDELDGRSIELWITEQTETWDDGEETTFKVPNVMDVKTEEFINIDNGVDGNDSSSDSSSGSSSGSQESKQSSSDSNDSDDSESSSEDSSGLPEGVPDKLDDLLDYMARNGGDDPDEIRNFAADEVDDPDEVDWEAAAEVVGARA